MTPGPARGSATLLLVCGGLSLLAVAIGGWICAASGVPMALWVRNLAAWLVGALAAWALARTSGGRLFPVVAGAGILALAATLFSSGQLGVHRWIGLGPLAVNAAMLTLPAAVVALGALVRQTSWWWALALAGLVLLVLQPDASQATALGAALAWLATKAERSSLLRAAVLAGVVLLVAGAWLRPDPLRPAPEVEEILRLAYAVSPALAGPALASLILFSLAPGWLARDRTADEKLAGGALSLYLLVCAAMPFLGAFPVPLVGIGVSPVLGSWLGVGVLAVLSRAKAKAAL